MASTLDTTVTIFSSILVGDAAWDGGTTEAGIELSRSGVIFKPWVNKNIDFKTTGIGLIRFEARGSATIYLNDNTDYDLVGFSSSSIVGCLNELNVGGVTLAASAVTSGLTLVAKELGNQAANGDFAVAAAETNIGTAIASPLGSSDSKVIWANDTWYAFAGATAKIYRWDGGTDWTEIQNTETVVGDGYFSGAAFADQIWTGPKNSADSVYSYNPANGVWTDRHLGGVAITDIANVGTSVAIIVSGEVFVWGSGTTWNSIGTPLTTASQILLIDGSIHVAGHDGVSRHVTGTTWTNLGIPSSFNYVRMADWSGAPVLAGRNSSTVRCIVYQWNGSTWLQLGADFPPSFGWFNFIATDSNGVLYARPYIGGSTYWYKYTVGTNTWDSVISTGPLDVSAGEFNPDDVAGCLYGYDVITFADDHVEVRNGYLTGEDWETFNNKSDAVYPEYNYWIDADNGNDTTGDGSKGAPFATLAAAAASFAVPTTVDEYGVQLYFHVGPGQYIDDVTLPYRVLTTIIGYGAYIFGDIKWNHDTQYLFGAPSSAFAPLLFLSGATFGDLTIFDLTSKNANQALPSFEAKSIYIDGCFVSGSIIQEQSGSSTAGCGSGYLKLYLDQCTWNKNIPLGPTIRIGGERESILEDPNSILLTTENCDLEQVVCGCTLLSDIRHTIFRNPMNYSLDPTDGSGTYPGIVCGLTSLAGFGEGGFVDTQVLSGTCVFGWNNVLGDIGRDSIKYDASSFADFGAGATYDNLTTDYELRDKAEGVGVNNSGWSGNLGSETTVQAALDTFDSFSGGFSAVESPTSAGTDVDLAESDAGSIHTNLNVTAETNFVLPLGCAVGLSFTFVVLASHTGRMLIRPDYAVDHLSTIRLEGTEGGFTSGYSLQSSAAAGDIGDVVTVTCISSTASKEEFLVTSMVGGGWTVSPFS